MRPCTFIHRAKFSAFEKIRLERHKIEPALFLHLIVALRAMLPDESTHRLFLRPRNASERTKNPTQKSRANHTVSNPRIVPVLVANFPASMPRRCNIET